MSDTHICSGCDSSFTLRGYHSHLLQTQDPLCCNVYDRLKKSYETYQLLEQVAAIDSSKEVEDVNNHDVDMDLDSTGENRNLEEVSDDKENNDLDSEMERICMWLQI